MTCEQLSFRNRAEFRRWLNKNHSKVPCIWIEYYKDGSPGISYSDSLEEALCFGWIDSILKRIDDRIYVRKFTPRRLKSRWSGINKNLVKELIKNRKMTKYGLVKVNQAKKDGSWDKKDQLEDETELRRLAVRLRRILSSQRKRSLLELFDCKGEKAKFLYARYYFDAKNEDTRKRRMKRIFEVLKGERPIL